MDRQALTPSLLAELYDREEDTYRLARREVERMGRRPPSAALQAIVADAGASLDELRAHARRRGVGLGSVRALTADTLHRLRDVAVGLFVDEEHAYRRALTTVRRGVDLALLLRAAAIDEGDDELARYCQRWVCTREHLVSEVVEQLEWFARHPMFSRSFGPLARASAEPRGARGAREWSPATRAPVRFRGRRGDGALHPTGPRMARALLGIRE